MRHLFLISAFFLSVLTSSAAVPSLPKASGISVGKLPNGVEYYLVTNTSRKGFADFALAQKGNLDRNSVRASLGSLSQFGKTKPYQYLAKKGIGYRENGFAEYFPSGTVLRFPDVPVFDAAAADSTLMTVFAVMQKYPYEQAVVVSGDINSTKLLERMQTLSMLVTPRKPLPAKMAAEWEPADSVIFECGETDPSPLASLQVSFLSAKIPAEDMATVRPVISRMFADELRLIMERRIRKSFKSAGIPLAGLELDYSGSGSHFPEERFSVKVITDKDKLSEATSVLAGVFAQIDRYGVEENEFLTYKASLTSLPRLERRRAAETNGRCVDKCIASYFYGESLASDSAVDDFLSGKRIPPHKERDLLGRYASAILSKDRNVILDYRSPEIFLRRDSLVRAYFSGWEKGEAGRGDWNFDIDTSRLVQPAPSMVKLKSIAAEPVTGGSVWTFPNGMKVIFKKMKTNGEFRYSFVFNTGYSAIPGLDRENIPYVRDAFRFYGVQGLDSEKFRLLLSSNGVSMHSGLSAVDFRISGSAPSRKLYLLLKAVYSLSSRRVFDAEAFNDWRNSREMLAAGEKIPGLSGSPIPEMAEALMARSMTNFGSGFLVIAGDFDEKSLQALLGRYLNGFKVGKVSDIRPRMRREPAFGTSVTRTGGATEVEYSMSAESNFSLAGMYGLKIAGMALNRALVGKMSSLGVSVKTETSYALFPVEAVSVTVTCSGCRSFGLPQGVETASAQKVQEAIQEVMEEISSKGVSEAEIKGYKGTVLSCIEAEKSDPRTVVDAAAARYSYGKDMLKGYKAALESVTPAMVKEILSSLNKGARTINLSDGK